MGPRLFRRGNEQAGYENITDIRLQWGHAYSGVETTPTTRTYSYQERFNGATPIQAWKLLENFRRGHPAFLLQWGHAYSGVETGQLQPDRHYGCTASMGPRLFRRGNSLIVSNHPATCMLREHRPLHLSYFHKLESPFPSSQRSSGSGQHPKIARAPYLWASLPERSQLGLGNVGHSPRVYHEAGYCTGQLAPRASPTWRCNRDRTGAVWCR